MTAFLYYLHLDAELEKWWWGRGGGWRGGEHGGGPTPTLDSNVDGRDFHDVRRRLVLLVVVAAGLRWSPLMVSGKIPKHVNPRQKK